MGQSRIRTQLRQLPARIDAAIHKHFLYPARRWLTLHHFSGIVMYLYALALIGNPSPAFVAFGERLQIDEFPTLFGVVFVIAGTILIDKPVSELTFRKATLPLFAYGGIIFSHLLNGGAVTPGNLIAQLAIFGFLQIAGTPLPPEGSRHDPGTA